MVHEETVPFNITHSSQIQTLGNALVLAIEQLIRMGLPTQYIVQTYILAKHGFGNYYLTSMINIQIK